MILPPYAAIGSWNHEISLATATRDRINRATAITEGGAHIGEAARRRWRIPRARTPRRAPASGGGAVTAPVAMVAAAAPARKTCGGSTSRGVRETRGRRRVGRRRQRRAERREEEEKCRSAPRLKQGVRRGLSACLAAASSHLCFFLFAFSSIRFGCSVGPAGCGLLVVFRRWRMATSIQGH